MKVLKCKDCGELVDYKKAHLHDQCPECGGELKVSNVSEPEDKGGDE